MQQSLAFSLAATQTLQDRVGIRAAVGLIGSTLSACYFVTYLLRTPTPLVQAAHVASLMVATLGSQMIEVVLTSLSSTYVPAATQGRLFAAMAVVKLGGSMTGNLYGSRLFQDSLADPSALALIGGGALPVVALSLPTFLVFVALTCFLPPNLANVSSARVPVSVNEVEDAPALLGKDEPALQDEGVKPGAEASTRGRQAADAHDTSEQRLLW